MMVRDAGGRAKVFFAHGFHALLLLAPSALLAKTLDGPTILFAIGVLAAGYFESNSVLTRFEPTEAGDRDRTALVMALVVGVSIITVFWLSQIEHILLPGDGKSLGQYLTIWGVLSMTVGAALRVAAIRTLRHRFLSDIQASDERIHSGIYAWLRHPSEVGTLWLTVGAALTLQAPLAATVATVVLVPAYLWRTRREEAAWSRMKSTAT